QGHKAPVVAVTIAPDNRRVLSAALDGTLKLWDAETFKPIQSMSDESPPGQRFIRSVSISPKEGWALSTGGYVGCINIGGVGTGSPLASVKANEDFVGCVSFSPDGRFAVSAGGGDVGGHDHAVKLWEIEQQPH